MSWVSGQFSIDTLRERAGKGMGLLDAYEEIADSIRANADLGEFPNMGDSVMPIRHLMPDKIFGSYEEADEAIKRLFSDWSRKYNVAVAYYDETAAKDTKKIKTLKFRLEKEQEKLQSYTEKADCKNFKAKLITCSSCESKINKAYIRNSRCPLCHADLRSKTVIDTTKRYKDKIRTLSKELVAEQKKQKLPVKYLIGYCEYVG